MFERISNEIDRQHGGAGPGALRSKIEALHEHYRKFLKKHVPGPHDWTTLIPFGEIVNMHPVLKRLRTTRHRDDDLATLAAEVPTLVKQWRRRAEKKLVALLPAAAMADDSDDEAGPDPAERLQLATSVFLREGDASSQTYPRALLIPHLLDLEHGPLKYATPDGPWTLDGIKHDPLGVGVVRDFCRYARLDVKTATAQQLDESSLRLQCKLCRDEWPLVLSWRQAVRGSVAYRATVFVDDSGLSRLRICMQRMEASVVRGASAPTRCGGKSPSLKRAWRPGRASFVRSESARSARSRTCSVISRIGRRLASVSLSCCSLNNGQTR